MIVLDTNVVSELLRGPESDPRVRRWIRGLDEQPVTTVLNRAELVAGVALLPHGERRSALAGALEQVLTSLNICLPFTAESSTAYAKVVASRTATGRPIGTMDALIAAVAIANGAGVATRDTCGFEGLGLRLIDPWQQEP